MSGHYAPGHILSSEVDFSEALDISRGAYREAIRALAAKGLIESRPRVGTRVLPRARWNLLDPEVVNWAFAVRPDMQFVRDLLELRAVIEPAAAEFAALRRDDNDLRVLEEAVDVIGRQASSTVLDLNAKRDFHNAIIQASHNDTFVALAPSLCAAAVWTIQFKQDPMVLPGDPRSHYERVYDFIVAGDGGAANAAMRALV